MSTVREHYLELLRLTKEYISQEYQGAVRIYAESSSFEYFKEQALKTQKPTKLPPPPQPVKTAEELSKPITPLSQTQSSLNAPAQKNPTENSKKTLAPPLNQSPLPTPSTSIPLSIKSLDHLEKKEEPAKTKKENSSFLIEPLGPAMPIHFNDIRKIAEERIPHFKFVEEIPADKEKSEQTNLVDVTIALIGCVESPKQAAFLTNIANALTVHGEKVTIIQAYKAEEGNMWDRILKIPSLQLVITFNLCLESFSFLHKHYRESTRQATHYLQDKPLLEISDLSLYMKEPKLKLSLWEHLKSYLKTS